MTTAWKRLTARGAERGATEALELVIAIPVLMILLVLGVAGGNIVRGNGAVDAAATAAARAASLQRSPDTARTGRSTRRPPLHSPTEAWTAPTSRSTSTPRNSPTAHPARRSGPRSSAPCRWRSTRYPACRAR